MILTCPNCGKNVSAADGMAGQLLKCASCDKRFMAPTKAEMEAAPKARPAAAPTTTAPASPAATPAAAFAQAAAPAALPPAPPPPPPDDGLAPRDIKRGDGPRPMLGQDIGTLGKADEVGKKYGDGGGLGPAALGAALPGLAQMTASLPVFGKLAGAVTPLVGAFGKLGGVLSGLGGKGPGQSGGAAPSGGGGSLAMAGAALGPQGAALGAAVGAVAGAVSALVNSFGQVTAAVTPFVQALNPAAMRQLEFAQRDASAVVGQAFIPWVRQAGETARFFADSMKGPSREAAAPVSAVASAFGGVMNAFSSLGATILGQLMPTFSWLAQGFKVVGNVIQGLVIGIGGVISAFAPWINAIAGVLGALLTPIAGLGSMFKDLMTTVAVLLGGFGGLMKDLFSAIGGLFGMLSGPLSAVGGYIQYFAQGLMKGVVVVAAFAANLLAAFGLTGALKGMMDSLGAGKQDSRGMAALTQGGTMGSTGFMDQMLANAFIAQPTGPEGGQKDGDFLKEIRDLVRDMKNKDWGDTIVNAIKSAAASAASGTVNAIGGTAQGALDYVKGGFGWGGERSELVKD